MGTEGMVGKGLKELGLCVGTGGICSQRSEPRVVIKRGLGGYLISPLHLNPCDHVLGELSPPRHSGYGSVPNISERG